VLIEKWSVVGGQWREAREEVCGQYPRHPEDFANSLIQD
jgi:hypothetical protein